jgi:hypothetical protein
VSYFRGIAEACLLSDFYYSADVNGDCQVIGSDVTRMVNYFRGGDDLNYCPNLPPLWPTIDDCPTIKPSGWPPCESPMTATPVNPKSTNDKTANEPINQQKISKQELEKK